MTDANKMTEIMQRLVNNGLIDHPAFDKTGGAENELQHGMNCAATVPTRRNDCTCGLKWRIMLQTEQEMHNAWRKRAEEAEAELAALKGKIAASDEKKLIERIVERFRSISAHNCVTAIYDMPEDEIAALAVDAMRPYLRQPLTVSLMGTDSRENYALTKDSKA